MNIQNPRQLLIGFGAQGKAWAKNLQDSSHAPDVYLRPQSLEKKRVTELGFNLIDQNGLENKTYDIILVLIPDQEIFSFLKQHEDYFQTYINPPLFIFAHGYAFTHHQLNQLFPKWHFGLLAPKAIASELRFQYEVKGSLGAVYDFTHPEDEKIINWLAQKIGITGLFKSSFEAETKADLFSERSLLCSLIPYASHYSFQKLREKGISKELAFMECYLEVRSISKAFVELGPLAFFNLISPNALKGSQIGHQLFFNSDTFQKFELLYRELELELQDNTIEQHSIDKIKQEALEFWEKSELETTYQELKDKLI